MGYGGGGIEGFLCVFGGWLDWKKGRGEVERY